MARIRYLTQDASKLRLRSFFLLMPRVPCTEGGPGQSQANVPINHENAWASDLCLGILPRGTAKKLLKSLVAPVAAFGRRGGIQRNESFRFVLSTTCLFFLELSSCTPWKGFCFSAVSREFSTAAAQGPIALGLWAANRASRRFV